MQKYNTITPTNTYKFGTQFKKNENAITSKNMRKVFFKIIVPNYNNMPYIKRCLDSILNQTFKDFIAIVVDDLSTDSSDKVCEMYARNYSDKFIYHQLATKGQAGAARNWAIDYPIESEYMWFIDSDDWINNNNVLQSLHDTIIANNYPDVVRCPLFHYFGDNDRRNWIDRMTPDIWKIALSGAGPVKNCIRSKFNYKFKENRAQWNDVIWFLRLYDNVDPKKIVCEKTICYTYNRLSITSCTNCTSLNISKRCIADQYKLYDDLEQETYKTEFCNAEKARMQKLSRTTYKPRISPDSLMKNAYVITINKDRYMQFIKLFYTFKNKPQPIYGSTIADKTKVENCLLSHIRIVKIAKELKMPYVCIFEDDAYPQDNIYEIIDDYLNAIPYDANLVLLGFSSYNKSQQIITKPFNKITTGTISGAHAYILFQSAYDDYLKYFNDKSHKRIADCYVFQAIKNSYVIDYPLFIQYSQNKSMNNHVGYILFGDHDTPPCKFIKIEDYLNKTKCYE